MRHWYGMTLWEKIINKYTRGYVTTFHPMRTGTISEVVPTLNSSPWPRTWYSAEFVRFGGTVVGGSNHLSSGSLSQLNYRTTNTHKVLTNTARSMRKSKCYFQRFFRTAKRKFRAGHRTAQKFSAVARQVQFFHVNPISKIRTGLEKYPLPPSMSLGLSIGYHNIIPYTYRRKSTWNPLGAQVSLKNCSKRVW